jgi:hypothetical protein
MYIGLGLCGSYRYRSCGTNRSTPLGVFASWQGRKENMFTSILSVVSSQGFWFGVGFGQGPLIFILLIISIDHLTERRKKIERQEKEDSEKKKKEEEMPRHIRSEQLGRMLNDTSKSFFVFIEWLKGQHSSLFLDEEGGLNFQVLFESFRENVAWGLIELILHNAEYDANPFYTSFTQDLTVHVYMAVAQQLYNLYGGEGARLKVSEATWKRGDIKERLLRAIDAEIARHIA